MGQIGRSWTFYKGKWHEGDVRILGASSQATWLGSLVFDGARGFEGVIPDLDRHSARINRSAEALGLKPTYTPEEIMELTRQGMAKFGENAAV
ncbi:MAG: aminotransferase class IV, partial [Brucellaceae bacterium]|nr:aminotransferase class IV [Brucellaceae bacterium]